MGPHVMLSVLANSILQMCLWFSRTVHTLSHRWLDTSIASQEEHLKSLPVRGLGPTEHILYYYWWVLGLKKIPMICQYIGFLNQRSAG